MFGDLRYNQKLQGERAPVREFCTQALGAAKTKLGHQPEEALVNLENDEYLDALEALGLKVQKASWVLPYHVYFLAVYHK